MSFLDELRIVEEFEGFRFCEWIEINDEYSNNRYEINDVMLSL